MNSKSFKIAHPTDEGNGKYSTFTITLQYNRFHKQIVWAACGLPQCIQINIGLPMRKGYVILWNFPWNLCRASKITRKLSDKKNFPLLQGFVLVEKRHWRETNTKIWHWSDHLRWEGGLATENRFKADVWSSGWKPIVVILFKFKHLVMTILWETTCN